MQVPLEEATNSEYESYFNIVYTPKLLRCAVRIMTLTDLTLNARIKAGVPNAATRSQRAATSVSRCSSNRSHLEASLSG